MSSLPEQISAVLGTNHAVECDNCFEMHTTADFKADPCAVKTLLDWAVHNERLTADEALALVSKISPDMLWDRLGDLLDDLVSGHFNVEEE